MQKKLHFHSLDALRFFAFLKVFLLHIPLVATAFPIFSFIKSGGGIGVFFFFVLSGFLISYLLIHEKNNSQTINLKNFFIRRTLRIWPLYLLVISLIYFLPLDFKTLFLGYNSNESGYDLDWRYSFTFLENYKMYLTDTHPKTSTIRMFWTLCIEEHFYILWGLVMFIIPKKRFLLFLIGSVFLAIIARYFEPMITQNHRIETNELFTNLDLFSIGGILGYFVATNYIKVSDLINKIPLWGRFSIILVVVLFVVFQSVVYPYHHPSISNIFRPTVIAILFTSLLAMFIPQNSKIYFSNKNPLTYLGKISYGLYVYHVFILYGLDKYFIYKGIVLDNWSNLSLFIFISFGASVIISSLSFHFFEKPFLHLREKITLKVST